MFSVSGIDHRSTLKRSILRFRSPEEAQRAVFAIMAIEGVRQESQVLQVEEIPVEFRVWYPRPITVLALLGFFTWLTFLLGALLYNFVVALILYALGIWIPMTTLPVIIGLAGRRRAWIRKEGRYVVLRMTNYSVILSASTIEWKGDTTILLKNGWKRTELNFSNRDEASRVFQMLNGQRIQKPSEP